MIIIKEILFIKNDLKKISSEPNRYKLVINAYKKKLVELGAMKELKDKYATKEGKFVKQKKELKLDNKTTKELKKKTEDKANIQGKAQKSAKNESETTTEPKRRGRPRKNA